MLKSIYIMAYLTISMMVTVFAASNLYEGGDMLLWTGVLLTAAPIIFIIGRIMIMKDRARTNTVLMPVLILSLVGVVLTFYVYMKTGYGQNELMLAATMFALYLLYDFWYAKLDRATSNIMVGGKLPAFNLTNTDGNVVSSDSFEGSPAIMIFYRGNWCPLCVAQVKEMAAMYNDLEKMGVKVMLISPQSQKHTRGLARQFDAAMDFMQDVGNEAARALGIAHNFGTPMGMQAMGYKTETVFPTVIITDKQGKVIWCYETDNYRVRPEPETYLKVLAENGVVGA